MTFTFKKLHVLALVAILPALATLPALAQEVKQVRIGGVPNDSNVAIPVQAAFALGAFKQAGVDVKFTGYNGGSAAMEALAAGAADVAVFTPSGTSLAVKRGIEAKVIAVGLTGNKSWRVIVKAGSPIKDVKDLKGKKVGITSSGSSTDMLALWLSKTYNLDLTRIPVGGAGLGPSVLSGNVDAVVTYPQVAYSLEAEGKVTHILDFGDVDALKTMVQSCWVASDAAIEKNPEGLKRMLNGLFSAVVYMKKHPEWAKPFIMKTMKVDAKVADQEYSDAVLDYSSDGSISPEAVKASLVFLPLLGEKDFPKNKQIYTDALVPAKTFEIKEANAKP